MRVGMQHGVIMADQPWGLPTDIQILPQFLKDAAGYATHLVGKWHVGHYTEAHLPRARGFDTFFGCARVLLLLQLPVVALCGVHFLFLLFPRAFVSLLCLSITECL